MARFKVLDVPNIGRLLRLDSGVNKEIAEAAGEPASRAVLPVVKQAANENYSNLIAEIGRKLAGSGMPLPTSSGARSLSIGLPGGSVGRVRTANWPALTEDYRKRSPKSFSFWKKEGRLSNAYTAQVSGTANVQIQEETAKRSHHKGRVNVRYLMKFSSLPFPFQSALASPFVTAFEGFAIRDTDQPEAVVVDGVTITPSQQLRLGLGRAIFPESGEYKRPFLRKSAAYLGAYMRKDLTKKLRKI